VNLTGDGQSRQVVFMQVECRLPTRTITLAQSTMHAAPDPVDTDHVDKRRRVAVEADVHQISRTETTAEPPTATHPMMAAASESDVCPARFLDPVTLAIMSDPVSTCDGRTFDRSTVEEWFKTQTTSPLTGAELATRVVVPNFALRESITGWRVKYHKIIPRSAIVIHAQIGEG
jgi:hypothetical protein